MSLSQRHPDQRSDHHGHPRSSAPNLLSSVWYHVRKPFVVPSMQLRIRNVSMVTVGVTLAFLFIKFCSEGSGGRDSLDVFSRSSLGLSRDNDGFERLRQASGNSSQFLAHAPGYSVISNAYWRNGTWLLITDQPWAMPDVKMVASNAPDYKGETRTTDKEIRILSTRAAEEEGLLDSVVFVDGVSVRILI